METENIYPNNKINNDDNKINRCFWWKAAKYISILILSLIIIIYFTQINTPSNYKIGSVYTISPGVGLSSLAEELQQTGNIRSSFWFKAFSVIFGGPKGIVAGDYVLDYKENLISLAKRMTSGDYHIQQIKVTLPEGLSISEMSKIISEKFPKINQKDFFEKAKGLEGYLFPDTYIFQINTGSETVIKAMQNNFERKILTIDDLIKSSKKSLSDIIKLASIIEEEGRTTETRRVIAGILWKRLSLKMPLQVDASFRYINGKTSENLTLDDLKIDSPYNSYIHRGLPPTPICNPGLDSIQATLSPIKTDYLFFLTDKVGVMHYAKTYEEHLKNKATYLK